MKVTGTVAVALALVRLAVAVWMIYLTIEVAEHVGAWPF